MKLFSKDTVKINGNDCTVRFERDGVIDHSRVTGLFKDKVAKCDRVRIEIGESPSFGYVYVSDSVCVVEYAVDEKSYSFRSIDGNLYSKDGKKLLRYAIGKKDNRFVVPDGVDEIRLCAFWGAKNLKEIILPNSLKKIENLVFSNMGIKSLVIPEGTTDMSNSFSQCNDLETLVIPSTLTNIPLTYTSGYSEFKSDVLAKCPRVKEISVHRDNNAFMSVDGNLYTRDGKILVKYAVGKSDTKFVVPNFVECIWYSAFSGCESLTEIEMSDSVKTIDSLAFYNCVNLKKIELSAGITSIGGCAFENCKSLEKIVIPESVNEIFSSAFKGCNNTVFNCKAKSKPEGWKNNWAPYTDKVIWGYKVQRSKELND